MTRVLAFALRIAVPLRRGPPAPRAEFVLVERVWKAGDAGAHEDHAPRIVDESVWLDACTRVGTSWFLDTPGDVARQVLVHAVPLPSPQPPPVPPSSSPSRPRPSKVVQLRVYPLPWLEGT